MALPSLAYPGVAATAARTSCLSQIINAARAQFRTGIPAAAPQRTGLRRQVFDCGGFEDLPGDLKRSEGDVAESDPTAEEAYDHAGRTWSFFHEVFGRESVTGTAAKLRAASGKRPRPNG